MPCDGERMFRATLTARDAPKRGPGWRSVVLDCGQGQTVLAYKNVECRAQVTDAELVRVMLAKHYLTEPCACMAELRRRYGVVA